MFGLADCCYHTLGWFKPFLNLLTSYDLAWDTWEYVQNNREEAKDNDTEETETNNTKVMTL